MKLVAVREYAVDHTNAVDLLYRSGEAYALKLTGGGEPDVWEVLSEASALQWLSECPEQILAVFDT